MNDVIGFVGQYGALVLFAVVFVEQIGLPLPAIPVLVAAGALAGNGHMSLWMVLGVTVSAALIADFIWYELGRRQGRRVLDWLCRIALEPTSCVTRTEAFFLAHGPQALVLAKFIPGLSTIAPPLAGIVGLRAALFLLFDGLGAVLWAGSSVWIGYVFSDQLEQALTYSGQATPLAVAVLALAGGYILYKAGARRRQLQRVPRIHVEALVEQLKTNQPPLLIDVRPVMVMPAPDIHVPNALRLSLDDLSRRHHELPRERDLILYCGCPDDVASAQGALFLREQGFTRVWALAGGIEAWRQYHEAVVHEEPLAGPATGLVPVS